MRKLRKALQRQLSLNQKKNLLHSGIERLLEIDATFLAALEELLGASSRMPGKLTVNDIAAEAADSLIDRIYTTNQFI